MSATIFRTLDLPGGSLLPFTSVPGERVRILCGRIWLTEEGNRHDAFLATGEEISLGRRGLAVIEALGPARVQLYKDVDRWSSMVRVGTAWMRRITRWLASHGSRTLHAARGSV